jgi:hypothetical protein
MVIIVITAHSAGCGRPLSGRQARGRPARPPPRTRLPAKCSSRSTWRRPTPPGRAELLAVAERAEQVALALRRAGQDHDAAAELLATAAALATPAQRSTTLP